MSQPVDASSRLARRLGTLDAVVIGLAAMIGAGIFAAIGPAAQAAGGGMLIGLAVAGAVAYCNASSSAQLAALYPRSGGAYVYGRERLGHLWGFAAGWGFVVGKIASCAAMALTFGAYAFPEHARPFAIGAVVALTAVNLGGIRATASIARVIVALVLGSLAAAVASMATGDPSWERVGSMTEAGPLGILQSAGLLFFAFAGYARIATLGEEVKDPTRTIPRAIAIALGITLIVYATVTTLALLAVGPDALAESSAPLATAVRAGGLAWALPLTRIGATIASLGVLLSLLAGVGRTAFSMADEGDLPRWFSAVHPRARVPHRAEIAIAAVVVTIVLVADLRGAIGFSSFAVLTYYAITNTAALTLSSAERRTPMAVAVVGVIGCGVLAFTLPWTSVVAGAAMLLVGVGAWWILVHRKHTAG